MRLDEQLLKLLDQLHQRAGTVFAGVVLDAPDEICDSYLRCLGDERAEHIARRIGRDLIDRSELHSEAFWATPLGRQLAWHVGYPYERCPAALVGPIIGTSRQYGHRASINWEVSRDAQGRRYVPSAEVRNLARRRMGAAPTV